MGNKNDNNFYVNEAMYAGRITAKGRITSIPAEGFSLKGKAPFTLFLRPKIETSMARNVVINCKLVKDSDFGDVPVSVGCWNELVIEELAGDTARLLTDYDMYWGSGNYAEEKV